MSAGLQTNTNWPFQCSSVANLVSPSNRPEKADDCRYLACNICYYINIILISRKVRKMEKNSFLTLKQSSSPSTYVPCPVDQCLPIHPLRIPEKYSESLNPSEQLSPQIGPQIYKKPQNGSSLIGEHRSYNESTPQQENKKKQYKKDVLGLSGRENARTTSRLKQKSKETEKGKKIEKWDSDLNYENQIENSDEFMLGEKQLQQSGKKHQKRVKICEKQRVNYSELNENSNGQNQRITSKAQQNLSPHLLQYFSRKYPYYLMGKTIAYPIQDSLFLAFPELKQTNSGRPHSGNKNHYEVQKLSQNFSSELQIWNIVKQHPLFFELRHEIELEDINLIIKHQDSSIFRQLFKAMHLFYLKDIIHHKYDECSSEEHYSFISLWKYADQNNLLDKIFVTCWNKLIQLYININKNGYSDAIIKKANQNYANLLRQSIDKGRFDPPQHYQNLLAYLLFLINMCFETHTFRNLINDKMLFFRDNNKMKNQLLEEKKDIESLIWEMKEQQKNLIKKQKSTLKSFKKEQKTTNNEEETIKFNNALEQIETQKRSIIQKRQSYLNEINSIENTIYELSCMPEFSNVWYLGEDRHRNLYWFIKGSENSIFKESHDGQWGKISNKNIDIFQSALNLRGIKEKKLYEKISYYKQLGYLKTVPQEETSKSYSKDELNQFLKNNTENIQYLYQQVPDCNNFTPQQVQNFNYLGYRTITTTVIKILILKSELMMSKYLYQRNSKWTTEDNRQLYIKRISEANIHDLETLTQDLRMFNQKICVVEINIKPLNTKGTGADASKTRKIQTKIWGINQKYKHFWYDYSRRCKNKSDLYFLVSILYLTIEKYVTKTRKPNNTKYFFKSVEFGQPGEVNENYCGYCQAMGELQLCSHCDAYLHLECLTKHESTECGKRKERAQ